MFGAVESTWWLGVFYFPRQFQYFQVACVKQSATVFTETITANEPADGNGEASCNFVGGLSPSLAAAIDVHIDYLHYIYGRDTGRARCSRGVVHRFCCPVTALFTNFPSFTSNSSLIIKKLQTILSVDPHLDRRSVFVHRRP